jgi:hypothetical protein
VVDSFSCAKDPKLVEDENNNQQVSVRQLCRILTVASWLHLHAIRWRAPYTPSSTDTHVSIHCDYDIHASLQEFAVATLLCALPIHGHAHASGLRMAHASGSMPVMQL